MPSAWTNPTIEPAPTPRVSPEKMAAMILGIAKRSNCQPASEAACEALDAGCTNNAEHILAATSVLVATLQDVADSPDMEDELTNAVVFLLRNILKGAHR